MKFATNREIPSSDGSNETGGVSDVEARNLIVERRHVGELLLHLTQGRADTAMDIFQDFKLPHELRPFWESGMLELVTEDHEKKTAEFHMPRLRRTDGEGRITTYSLTWIHPDFNAQFCHYYSEMPGDSPNFYVTEDTTDVGDELLEITSIDELVEWLETQTEHA